MHQTESHGITVRRVQNYCL